MMTADSLQDLTKPPGFASPPQNTFQVPQDLEAKLQAQSEEIQQLKKALVAQTQTFRVLLQKEKESRSGLEAQVARLTAELKIRDQKLESAKSEVKMGQRVEELKREVKNIRGTVQYERKSKEKLWRENEKLRMEIRQIKATKEEETMEKKLRRNSYPMPIKRVEFNLKPLLEEEEELSELPAIPEPELLPSIDTNSESKPEPKPQDPILSKLLEFLLA
ncbi:unnamed protein product [Caenorhabditis brenneri]